MSIKNFGFSLVEIILAVALFSVFAAGGFIVFVPVLNQNRQSGDFVEANRLAEQGIEAVRSIRNQDFSLITAGTKGIGVSNNLWSFSGTSDKTDKYTRQIIITSANRDAGGTLVSSGGTTDPDTWLIQSLITWAPFSVGDTKQFSTSTFLTNWKKPTSGLSYDGLIVYDRGASTVPFLRTYTTSSNNFSVASTLPAFSGRASNFILRTSPTKSEAILGIGNSSGTLYVYCFNGTTWTQDWSATIGGTGATRRFDIAYENTTGNAVVLFSTNTATTNELNFRTKSGTSGCGSANWNSATAFDPVRTSALISWVKMVSNPTTGSNLIGAIWADWNKDLSGAIWNGSAFQNEMSSVGETSLEAVNTGISFPDVESFDLAYESLSGDLLTVWGVSTGTNGVGGVKYRLCTGNSATCSWGTTTTAPTFADDATNMDLSANSSTDEMVFASIGNAGADMQLGYWSGVGWSNVANVDTACATPVAGSKLVATGWLNSGSTKRSVIVYNDSATTNINWYIGIGKTFTVQTAVGVTPVFASPQQWYETYTNPKSKDQLMLTLSDNSSNLYAKRLTMTSTPTFTWAAADGNVAIGTSLSQNKVKPFGFAYFQK